jgi:hypothetical protein
VVRVLNAVSDKFNIILDDVEKGEASLKGLTKDGKKWGMLTPAKRG